MWVRWGKCIKRQCTILLIFSGMVHCVNIECYFKWGTAEWLWGVAQSAGVFDGSVDGFAVFPVFLCRAVAAHVVAVLVIV